MSGEDRAELLVCSCGARFRTALAETRHQRNFPMYCRPTKPRGPKPKSPDGLLARRKSRAKAPR